MKFTRMTKDARRLYALILKMKLEYGADHKRHVKRYGTATRSCQECAQFWDKQAALDELIERIKAL